MRKIWRRVTRHIWLNALPRDAVLRATMQLLSRRGTDSRARTILANESLQFVGRVLADGSASHSQIFQDLWVLHKTQFMRNGFFVEFGATDGKGLSNTYLLEKSYGWTGILAEPNPVWHDRLRANRSCAIVTECVTGRTGDVVSFLAADEPELSTLAHHVPQDQHAAARNQSAAIQVKTISLNDLLHAHNAPARIDFLSVDTEGSELEILSAVDFKAWNIRLIAVEHNQTDAEEKLDALLTSHGYRRCLKSLSWFDGWYEKID